MTHNVSLVCDAAPSLTEARGRCGDEARRSAEEPEAPSEAPMHIRAVMRSARWTCVTSTHRRARSELRQSLRANEEISDSSSLNILERCR